MQHARRQSCATLASRAKAAHAALTRCLTKLLRQLSPRWQEDVAGRGVTNGPVDNEPVSRLTVMGILTPVGPQPP